MVQQELSELLPDLDILNHLTQLHEVERLIHTKDRIESTLWASFQSEIQAVVSLFPQLLLYVILAVITVLLLLQLFHLIKLLSTFAYNKYNSRNQQQHYQQREQHIQECFACGHFQWVSNAVFPYPPLRSTTSSHDHSNDNLKRLACFSQTSHGYHPVPVQSPNCSLVVARASNLSSHEKSLLYHPQTPTEQTQSDHLHSLLDQTYSNFISTLTQTTMFKPPFHFTVPFVCCREDCLQLNGEVDLQVTFSQIKRLQTLPEAHLVPAPSPSQESVKASVKITLPHQNQPQQPIPHINKAASLLLPPQAPALCSACIDDQQYRLSQKQQREKVWYQQQVRAFLKRHLLTDPTLPAGASKQSQDNTHLRDQLQTHLKRRHISLREIIPQIDEDIDELVEKVDLPLWMLPPPPMNVSRMVQPQSGNEDEGGHSEQPQSLDFSPDFSLCRRCEESLQKFNLSMIAYTREVQQLNKQSQSPLNKTNSGNGALMHNRTPSNVPSTTTSLSLNRSNSTAIAPHADTNMPLNRTNSTAPLGSTVTPVTPLLRKRLGRGLDSFIPGRPLQPTLPPPPLSNAPSNQPPDSTGLRNDRERHRNPNPLRNSVNDSMQSPLSIDQHLETKESAKRTSSTILSPVTEESTTPSSIINAKLLQHQLTRAKFHQSDLYQIQLPILYHFSLLNRLLFHTSLFFTTLLLEPLKFITFLLLYPIVVLVSEATSHCRTTQPPAVSQLSPFGPEDSHDPSRPHLDHFYNPTHTTTLPISKHHIQSQKASYLIQFHSVLSLISEYRQQNNNPPHRSTNTPPPTPVSPQVVNQLFQRHNYLDEWNGYETQSHRASPSILNASPSITIQPNQQQHEQELGQASTPYFSQELIARRHFSSMLRSTLYTLNIPLRAVEQALSTSKFAALIRYLLALLLTLALSVIFHSMTSSSTSLPSPRQFLEAHLSSYQLQTIQKLLPLDPKIFQHLSTATASTTDSSEIMFYYITYKFCTTLITALVGALAIITVSIATQLALSTADTLLLAIFAIITTTAFTSITFLRFITRTTKNLFARFCNLCLDFSRKTSPRPQTPHRTVPQSNQECPQQYSSPLLRDRPVEEFPAPLSLDLSTNCAQDSPRSSSPRQAPDLAPSPDSVEPQHLQQQPQQPQQQQQLPAPQPPIPDPQPVQSSIPHQPPPTAPIFAAPTQPTIAQSLPSNFTALFPNHDSNPTPFSAAPFPSTNNDHQTIQAQTGTFLSHTPSQQTPYAPLPYRQPPSFSSHLPQHSTAPPTFLHNNSVQENLVHDPLSGLSFDMVGLELAPAGQTLQIPMGNLAISHQYPQQVNQPSFPPANSMNDARRFNSVPPQQPLFQPQSRFSLGGVSRSRTAPQQFHPNTMGDF